MKGFYLHHALLDIFLTQTSIFVFFFVFLVIVNSVNFYHVLSERSLFWLFAMRQS